MKTFKIQVRVWDLGCEPYIKTIETKAKTEASAEKKAEKIMGNRAFEILGNSKIGTETDFNTMTSQE